MGTRPGRVLRARKDKGRYLLIGLRRPGGGQCTTRVHRLVATAFLGPLPEGHETNHKDGDKANNRAGNLEYLTNSENQLHAYLNGEQSGPGRFRDTSMLESERHLI